MTRYKVYTKEKGLVETDDYFDFSDLTWHRLDGPAVIQYYDHGGILHESYYINGKRHRLNGPAFTSYYVDGNISQEDYWVENSLHRLNGYASIVYNRAGEISSALYYINSKYYSDDDYHKELLRMLPKDI